VVDVSSFHVMAPAADDSTRSTSREVRLATLFDAGYERLYRFARRLSADAEEARDLAQEAFLRAAARAASLPADDEEAFAWLARVVVNLCRDRHRRLAVRRRAAESQRDDAAAAPEAAAEDRAVARHAVQSALARLPARRRAIVVLHELEGEPVETIARLLGLSRVTVRWHLSRARRELRAVLDPWVGR
jgi:RNA polymerase sigma factor (sigma-70 family)